MDDIGKADPLVERVEDLGWGAVGISALTRKGLGTAIPEDVSHVDNFAVRRFRRRRRRKEEEEDEAVEEE